MYSVEWVPKGLEDGAWNQWALTRWQWVAKWAVWDFKHALRKSTREYYSIRIRQF
jgi:hypothetical protein